MKRLVATFLLVTFAASAIAACPPHAPYRCIPGPNGKMICGCGV